MDENDKPNAARYKGYDLDLHYSPDESLWYCSCWKDGKGIHSETYQDSCGEFSGSPTQEEAIRKAKQWIEKYIEGSAKDDTAN